MDNYNGTNTSRPISDNKETWKALDLYGIAVSDKGRIMVNGEVIEPSPPNNLYKRYYFSFTNPKTGKYVGRDAAIMVWRAFKGKVSKEIKITFKDGDMSNLNLDNLQWEYRSEPIREKSRKIKMTEEEMRARTPLIIEKMVEMWGVNKG